MKIKIIRKESVTVQEVEADTNVITKYEIMDDPIKNETYQIDFS